MKKVIAFTCLLFVYQIIFAQSKSVELVINQIEFQNDTIKSVFDWIANNITYDTSKLNDIKEGDKSSIKKNIESLEELRELQLERVLSRKKGVCEDYSILFDAIISKLGYSSYIIEGYTKNEQGIVQRRLGHTWNAVLADGDWSLYDPTWGAGYVVDNRKFIKHYSKEWFDISSDKMIKTHMPFDPIWQLSKQPISYQCFEEGVTTSFSGGSYNFQELISSYLLKERKDQMREQIQRSLNIGDGIWLIERWRKNLRSNIDYYEITSQALSIDDVNRILEESSELFNDHIKARNKQFRSKKWSRDYSKEVLQKIKTDISTVLTSLKNVDVEDSKMNRSVEKVIIQTERFLKRINEEIEYMDNISE